MQLILLQVTTSHNFNNYSATPHPPFGHLLPQGEKECAASRSKESLHVRLRTIFAQRQLFLFRLAMQVADFAVPRVVPDLGDRLVADVAENFFARVVETAERDVAVDEDRQRPPDAVARLANLPIP